VVDPVCGRTECNRRGRARVTEGVVREERFVKNRLAVLLLVALIPLSGAVACQQAIEDRAREEVDRQVQRGQDRINKEIEKGQKRIEQEMTNAREQVEDGARDARREAERRANNRQ
jgi:predicted Holliday junction resolvase-like endonuclease